MCGSVLAWRSCAASKRFHGQPYSKVRLTTQPRLKPNPRACCNVTQRTSPGPTPQQENKQKTTTCTHAPCYYLQQRRHAPLQRLSDVAERTRQQRRLRVVRKSRVGERSARRCHRALCGNEHATSTGESRSPGLWIWVLASAVDESNCSASPHVTAPMRSQVQLCILSKILT